MRKRTPRAGVRPLLIQHAVGTAHTLLHVEILHCNSSLRPKLTLAFAAASLLRTGQATRTYFFLGGPVLADGEVSRWIMRAALMEVPPILPDVASRFLFDAPSIVGHFCFPALSPPRPVFIYKETETKVSSCRRLAEGPNSREHRGQLRSRETGRYQHARSGQRDDKHRLSGWRLAPRHTAGSTFEADCRRLQLMSAFHPKLPRPSSPFATVLQAGAGTDETV